MSRQQLTPLTAEDQRIKDTWVFWSLVGLMFWMPLPLASNRTIPVYILITWAVFISLAQVWVWRHHLPQALAHMRRYAWPLGLLLLFVLLVWFQSVPLPKSWVAELSPLAFEKQRLAEVVYLSLTPQETRLYAFLSTAYLCLFASTLLLVRDKRRLELLSNCIVFAGVFQAVLGVILFSLGAHYKLAGAELIHDRVKGSFVYHNHFAGYMELCLSVGIGLMLAHLGEKTYSGSGWRHWLTNMFAFLLSPKMRLRLLLVVMVIALVLTRSRMGNAGFFSAMLIVGVLSLILTRRSAPAMVALIISLIVVDVVVIGTWVGLEKVVARVQETTLLTETGRTEESVEQRETVALKTLSIIKDYPLFGTGAGSFYKVYFDYYPSQPPFWDHTHNDYAEWASNHGLIGLVIMGAFVLLTFIVSAVTLAKRRSAVPRGMAFGTLMAIVAIAIHSWVDFNLQLPTNAATLMVILAMGWSAYRLPSPRSR